MPCHYNSVHVLAFISDSTIVAYDSATVWRCFPWEDIEAAIWATGKIPRRQPTARKLTLEERVKRLEERVFST